MGKIYPYGHILLNENENEVLEVMREKGYSPTEAYKHIWGKVDFRKRNKHARKLAKITTRLKRWKAYEPTGRGKARVLVPKDKVIVKPDADVTLFWKKIGLIPARDRTKPQLIHVTNFSIIAKIEPKRKSSGTGKRLVVQPKSEKDYLVDWMIEEATKLQKDENVMSLLKRLYDAETPRSEMAKKIGIHKLVLNQLLIQSGISEAGRRDKKHTHTQKKG